MTDLRAYDPDDTALAVHRLQAALEATERQRDETHRRLTVYIEQAETAERQLSESNARAERAEAVAETRFDLLKIYAADNKRLTSALAGAREALTNIAQQHTNRECQLIYGDDFEGDLEGAFEAVIMVARAAIHAPASEKAEGDAK